MYHEKGKVVISRNQFLSSAKLPVIISVTKQYLCKTKRLSIKSLIIVQVYRYIKQASKSTLTIVFSMIDMNGFHLSFPLDSAKGHSKMML